MSSLYNLRENAHKEGHSLYIADTTQPTSCMNTIQTAGISRSLT